MQLLYVANRFEYKPRLDPGWPPATSSICDRYRASSVAYGEAQGLDPAWLEDIQRHLPAPDLTVLLDIAPETAVAPQGHGPRPLRARPRAARRASARATAARPRARSWVVIDAELPKDDVAEAVDAAVLPRLAPPSARARS